MVHCQISTVTVTTSRITKSMVRRLFASLASLEVYRWLTKVRTCCRPLCLCLSVLQSMSSPFVPDRSVLSEGRRCDVTCFVQVFDLESRSCDFRSRSFCDHIFAVTFSRHARHAFLCVYHLFSPRLDLQQLTSHAHSSSTSHTDHHRTRSQSSV